MNYAFTGCVMFGIGTDIVEIKRIKKILTLYPNKFPVKILGDAELGLFNSRPKKVEFIAGRFAAKEAILKALGTGLRNCSWADITIINDDLGKPQVSLSGNLMTMAKANAIKQVHISISHGVEFAVAFCIIE